MAVEHGYGKIVTDGLVLCLDAADNNSYPGSGNTWYNLTKKGSNATFTGGANHSTDNFGRVNFDNETSQANSSLKYSLYSNFTISSMFYNQGHVGSFGVVLATRYGNNMINGIRVINSSISFYSYEYGNMSIGSKLNDWVYVTATLSSSNYANVYMDGELTNSGTFSKSNRNDTTIIGRSKDDQNGTYRSFIGKVANIKIYNRVLTPQEVLQNYNATKTRFGL